MRTWIVRARKRFGAVSEIFARSSGDFGELARGRMLHVQAYPPLDHANFSHARLIPATVNGMSLIGRSETPGVVRFRAAVKGIADIKRALIRGVPTRSILVLLVALRCIPSLRAFPGSIQLATHR